MTKAGPRSGPCPAPPRGTAANSPTKKVREEKKNIDRTIQKVSEWSLNQVPWPHPIKLEHSPYTLDLSEFNVDVMTGNNGAHQRSPNDPGIQK